MSPRSTLYLDGFVLPVAKKNLPKYRRIARLAGKVWREHGALEYREFIGDDLDVKGMMPFPKMVKTRPGEVVFLSYITYKSKAHRNQVNAKVMKDPRFAKMIASKEMPFDTKRMAYGGFRIAVDL
jgi:uncharacterized protein YbaA (DUF1428 family)